MHHVKIWSILNTLGLIVVLIVNTLANSLPINGRTTGEISDAYPNLFTPAGFTFAIWGLIYLALICFCIYQLIVAWRQSDQAGFIARIGPFFLLSCLANATWIFAWHHEIIWLALVIMLILFASLCLIYLRLDIGQKAVAMAQRWLVQAPVSLYLGWITIATIANVTILLTDLGWNGFGIDPRIWTLLVLWAGLSIGYRVWKVRQDVIFVLVIAWAYFGVLMKRMDQVGGLNDMVAIGALTGIVIAVILVAYRVFGKTSTTT
ncbi:MAG: hypothetical protein R3301_04940 [Saprospiraceae bacterium]|nr:hypothetical protein [Saprospiraceae bacterium]